MWTNVGEEPELVPGESGLHEFSNHLRLNLRRKPAAVRSKWVTVLGYQDLRVRISEHAINDSQAVAVTAADSFDV